MEKETIRLILKYEKLTKEEMKSITGGALGTVCGPRNGVPTSICPSGKGVAANSGTEDPSKFPGIVGGFCNVIILCIP
ncbi:bacteriocin [Flavobacterium hungaricum]|uniref:Bacteriocin n=1 Tax=Flavobacterium hungaricum TaxID=2082725 RepID=A0ABR9TQY6_9FLAO|nr:bacteriocin [Flavobacterium hungaricum]MBE8727422.1 bacteriocin [Flavobacterium hungaricum]